MNRQDFTVFYPVYTRWMDNDVYGHVNNVTYYSYFDSTINRYLIEHGDQNCSVPIPEQIRDCLEEILPAQASAAET